MTPEQLTAVPAIETAWGRPSMHEAISSWAGMPFHRAPTAVLTEGALTGAPHGRPAWIMTPPTRCKDCLEHTTPGFPQGG